MGFTQNERDKGRLLIKGGRKLYELMLRNPGWRQADQQLSFHHRRMDVDGIMSESADEAMLDVSVFVAIRRGY